MESPVSTTSTVGPSPSPSLPAVTTDSHGICYKNSTSFCVDVSRVLEPLFSRYYPAAYLRRYPCYCMHFTEERIASQMFTNVIHRVALMLDNRVCVVSFTYIVPIILLLGLIGNTLTLLVFSRRHFSEPTYIYFRCLAGIELVLTIAFIHFLAQEVWLMNKSRSYLYAFYRAYIQLQAGIALAAADSYLLVAIIVDRYIAVCHPYRLHTLVTRRRTQITAMLCFLIPLLLVLPGLRENKIVVARAGFAGDEVESAHELYMFMAETEQPLAYNVYKVVAMVLLIVSVHVLIVVLTLVTVVAYIRLASGRKQAMATHTGVSGLSQGDTSADVHCNEPPALDVATTAVANTESTSIPLSTATYSNTSLDECNRSVQNTEQRNSNDMNSKPTVAVVEHTRDTVSSQIKARVRERRAEDRRILILMVSATTSYVVFTLPFFFHTTIFELVYKELLTELKVTMECISMFSALCLLALDFYVYLIVSKFVRQEFVALVRCCRKVRKQS